MGFRFCRSFKIAPGFRLNFSKTGVSTSVGRRGLWFTIGARGTRTTVGVPGTGLSYTEQSRLPRPAALVGNSVATPAMPPSAASAAPSETPRSSGPMRVIVFLAIVGLVVGVFLFARL
jgi:Protein of unknown function (DUF4236)